jgi:hypothetical protein
VSPLWKGERIGWRSESVYLICKSNIYYSLLSSLSTLKSSKRFSKVVIVIAFYSSRLGMASINYTNSYAIIYKRYIKEIRLTSITCLSLPSRVVKIL